WPLWKDEALDLNEDWCVGALWMWPGQSTPRRVPLEIFERIDDWRVRINLGKAPENVPCPSQEQLEERQVLFKLRLRFLQGQTLGRSLTDTSIILLATSTMQQGERGDDDIRRTLVHEIGHAVGMVPFGQESRYVGCTHVGPHCSTGGKWDKEAGWSTYGSCI